MSATTDPEHRMSTPTDTGRFALGDLALDAGDVLPGASLSWKSYGTLSPARDNVVVYPTSYSAQHTDQEWLIAPDKVLDPERWFVVAPDMFGNGLSSSPSNTPAAWTKNRISSQPTPVSGRLARHAASTPRSRRRAAAGLRRPASHLLCPAAPTISRVSGPGPTGL